MALIPLEIVEQVERGNTLLFVGDRLVSDDGGHSEPDRWGAELALRCGLPGSDRTTFAVASQLYEDLRGRQALVQFVRDQLEEAGDEPSDVHRLIAALSECSVIATTCLDRRLERALTEASRQYTVLVRNADIAFIDVEKTQIYKLRGVVEQADSLVLTEDDYDQFFDDENSISVVLQGYLARSTVLFLGYDLTDPSFKRLYRRVTASLDNFARRAYVFGRVHAPAVKSWCRRHEIEVIDTASEVFLRELVEKLSNRRAPQPRVASTLTDPGKLSDAPLSIRPYKLLDYYGPEDANIYFARETETQHLVSLIHGHRLTLLYGASGTGKTSLLLAGVMPRLEQATPGYAVVYVRVLENPIDAIRRQVQRRLGVDGQLTNGSLVTFLESAVLSLERPLVVMLDQFEEFFMRLSDSARVEFIEQLAELNEARVQVKVVISLREDWLAYMNEVRARIPEIFNVDVRLLLLTPEQARRAITGPAALVGLEYEPALVDRLLTDLGEMQREMSGSENANALMPPHLQLICDSLYEHATAHASSLIGLSDYVAVGEVAGVLSNYIDDALRKHPGAQREVARRLLVALVSSQATKYVSDIDTVAAEIGANLEVVETVLKRLIDQRLVRQLDDEHHYELAHDSLAAAISGWISEEERQRKQVLEMIRRQEREWREDPSLILGRGKFDRINLMRSELNLSHDETVFVLRAALLYDQDVKAWLNRIDGESARIDRLLDAVRDPLPQTRISAVNYLQAYAIDRVSLALAQTALNDNDTLVCTAAAQGVGRMRLPVGFKTLTAAVDMQDPVQSEVAVAALAHALDEASYMLPVVPRPLRRHLIARLAKIRLSRHRSANIGLSIAGATGGAVGMGIGLGLLTISRELEVFENNGSGLADAIVFILVFALIGMVVGATLGYGTGIGYTLSFRRPWLGIPLGAMFGGAVSFTLVIAPIGAASLRFGGSIASLTIGTALFGALVGLGTAIPLAAKWPWWTAAPAGALGGAIGIVISGMSGYAIFNVFLGPASSAPLILAAGIFTGLGIALGIARRERHDPFITARGTYTPQDKGRSTVDSSDSAEPR